jgi:hypothetical protein
MDDTQAVPWQFHKLLSGQFHKLLSGLKARATIAWGNAPGHNRLTICGLKARAKCLIRNSQLHESKSFSIEDIFLSPFPAQKSHVKPQNHPSH